jgi:transcriptional regulator with XRE-family HTH domain
MRINSELVKQLRANKHWSQQQLSDACGLNLRTIQRLESSGKASIETVRALAAVFEVSPDDLTVPESGQPEIDKPETGEASMSLFTAAKYCFINYANFEGRASRAEYWWFFLFVLLIAAISKVLHEKLYLIIAILTLLPLLAAGTRRFNDVGHSGWCQLLFLVPFGFVPVFIMLALKGESQEQETASEEGATLKP